MIELNRITRREDMPEALMRLYEESFPDEERRCRKQLFYLLENRNALFFCEIRYNGQSAGLFVYWRLNGFCFLEHLAIFPVMRNHNIGSRLLAYIDRYLPGPRLLEVEPADDGMAGRRIRYYERNGYAVVEKDYVQPAFDPTKRPIPLWIMCNQPLSDRQRADYVRTIVEEVYRANFSCIDIK